MAQTILLVLALLSGHVQRSLAIEDHIPFGKDRLEDFFFIQNGTLFRQFVIILCRILSSCINPATFLESWCIWWHAENGCSITISVCRTNGSFDRKLIVLPSSEDHRSCPVGTLDEWRQWLSSMYHLCQTTTGSDDEHQECFRHGLSRQC